MRSTSIGAGTRPTTPCWSSPATSPPTSCGRWPRRTYGGIAGADPPARRRLVEPPQHARAAHQPRRSAGTAAEPDPILAGAELRLAGQEHAYALEVLAEILGGGGTTPALSLAGRRAGARDRRRRHYQAGVLDRTTLRVYLSPRPGIDWTLEGGLDAELGRLLATGRAGRGRAHAAADARRGGLCPRLAEQRGAVIGAALTAGRTVEDVEAWPADRRRDAGAGRRRRRLVSVGRNRLPPACWRPRMAAARAAHGARWRHQGRPRQEVATPGGLRAY